MKNKNGISVNVKKGFTFNEEAFKKGNFSFGDILEVYLSYDKSSYLKNIIHSKIKEYDSVYSLAEVNLLE